MGWLELLTLAIQAFIRLLTYLTLGTGRLALYFIRLAAYPIAVIWATFLFVFSPVTHTVRFVLSSLFWLLNSFQRLQPLYIYFGSAAFIGLVAGVLLKLTSTSVITIFNLYDDPNSAAPAAAAASTTNNNNKNNDNDNDKPKHSASSSYSNLFSSSGNNNSNKKTTTAGVVDQDSGYGYDYRYGYEEDQEDGPLHLPPSSSRPMTPNSQFRAEQRELETLLANLSAAAAASSPNSHSGRGRGSSSSRRDLDAVLAAALTGSLSTGGSGGGGGWRDGPNIKRKRRSGPLGLGIGGLSSSSRFHTILEEEDDDSL